MEKLKNLITRNTTQKKVAEELNISPQTLSNYINDKTIPDIETLIKIADYFKTTVDSIIGHEVPYLLDKSRLTNEQIEVINKVIDLSREQCMMLDAYIEGLKNGERNRQETIKRLKGE